MQPDLQLVLRGAKRWWWVLVILPILMGSLAYAYSNSQTPVYAASSTLQVTVTDTSSSLGAYNQLIIAEQTSKLYQEMVTLGPVMDDVVTTLGLSMTPDELASMITARAKPESVLITIEVSDTDAKRAADIANQVPLSLQKVLETQHSETGGLSSDLAPYVTELNTRIADLQTQIAAMSAAEDEGTPVPAVMGFMQDTLDGLTTLRDNLSALQAGSQVATVTVIAPAVVPDAPYSPKVTLTTAFGVFAGLVFAAGIIMVLVYLDSTIKSSADFQALVGSPLLSAVTKVPRMTEGRQQLFVIDQPSSEAAESIRLLRTNVEFASAVQEIATLAVSSPASGDGKSTVAANLAVTLSQAGFVTALVDADLRRPEQHKIFQVRNDRGLSTVLSRPDVQWHQTVIETGLTNLVLVPSGPVPPNAADLLSLKRLGEVLTDMKRLFDIVIIDTPPILPVSDALAVASHVDGMILVCRSGRTRIDALRRAATTLQRGAVRIVGVVVNHEKTSGSNNYYASEIDGHSVMDAPVEESTNPLRALGRKLRGGNRQQPVAKTVSTTL
jgi:succinoglycan biosynthesis transport protein ExoP